MATKKTSGEVSIPRLKWKEMTVTIQGVTPIIFHCFSKTAKAKMREAQAQTVKASQKKPPRDPEAETMAALYLTADGHPGFPAYGIRKAMVTAGSRFTEETKVGLCGVIKIRCNDPNDILPVRFPEGGEPEGREDIVNIGGRSRTTDLRYRPMLRQWEIDVPIRYCSDLISAEKVVNLLQIAGETIGIGDWRIEKNGKYGEFEVKTG